jgi:hypothetical protein
LITGYSGVVFLWKMRKWLAGCELGLHSFQSG